MSQTKLQVARELIQDHRYDDARAILETIPDDPTAREWLAKIDARIAKRPDSTRAAHQRWEYCLLGSVVHVHNNGRMQTGDTVIVHFSSDGKHEIQSKVDVPTAIAKLGEQGWELVTTGAGLAVTNLTGTSGIPGHVLYFKRALE